MSGYGSVAKYFDGEYDGFRQDIDFYLDRLQADRVRGPVLEPGCGTGRVVAPLAVAGFRVSGFDTSDAMLRRRSDAVIHHSDQGTQHTSIAFGGLCEGDGVRPSTGSLGDFHDNALCEPH